MRDAVAPRAGASPATCRGAGLGLRLPHLAEAATANPEVEWFEVHPENYLANPHARELLLQISERHAISMHSVGVSVGSADGLDTEHLNRICDLAADINPIFISGHPAWSSYDGIFLNDLLPLPYDEKTLALVASHVDQVQDALQRQYLVENPASYFGFESSTLAETQFLAELAASSGCGLLCDVSNVFVSGWNLGFDPYDYIDNFPGKHVMELHLGGFTMEQESAADDHKVLIDSHAEKIATPVWALYEHTIERHGRCATLIERDSNLPSLNELNDEARQADALAAAVIRTPSHAVAG